MTERDIQTAIRVLSTARAFQKKEKDDAEVFQAAILALNYNIDKTKLEKEK